MIPNRPFLAKPTSARGRILVEAVRIVREKGFAATSVDDLCRAAGVTKGAFFHHFASKEALGVALAGYWSDTTGEFFKEAPYHHHQHAVDRVLGYIDLRIALLSGPPQSFTCVAGTMVQESFLTSTAIREACNDSIMGNAAALEADIAEAIRDTGAAGVTAASLSQFVQTVIQGAFILAKAQDAAQAEATARDQLRHLRRYFELLFGKGSGHAS